MVPYMMKMVRKITDKLINFYDQISLKKGYKVDGTNVSQEATADLGGMKIILEIVKKYDNFDYDKFFRAYAYLWCCKTFDISLVEPYLWKLMTSNQEMACTSQKSKELKSGNITERS